MYTALKKSGFKFSDLYGGIQYDAGNDRLTLVANYGSAAGAEITFDVFDGEKMRLNGYGSLGVGTTNPAGRVMAVYTTYSSGQTPLYAGNTGYTAWNRQSYDTFVLQQDDVTSFRMVEKNGEATGSDQVLSFSVGDGFARIASTAQPLEFFVNGSPSGLAYQGLSGTKAIQIATSGASNFYGNITIDKGSPTLRLAGSAYGNSGARIQIEGWASGSGYQNWQIDTAFTGNNTLNFVPSTTAGGSTYSTPCFTLSASGLGTFSSSVYASGTVRATAGNEAVFRAQGGGYGDSYNTTLRSIAGATGVLQFGNNGENFILAGNTAAGGVLNIRVNCSSESIVSGTAAMRIDAAAVVTFYNSVTATSFFESSDKAIKTLIEDNYQAKGIESVKAKLYVKNGKEELGYYAQDLQDILPSAVSKGTDGLLSLSYREVHTAKIARLEKEVEELKSQLARL
jgi:hypothetical protein